MRTALLVSHRVVKSTSFLARFGYCTRVRNYL